MPRFSLLTMHWALRPQKTLVHGERQPLIRSVPLPVYPGRHSQAPVWLNEMQLAFGPQMTEEQAAMQTPECCSQAVSSGQSLSVEHFEVPMHPSLYGSPTPPGRHSHLKPPRTLMQIELAPQGPFGSMGSREVHSLISAQRNVG